MERKRSLCGRFTAIYPIVIGLGLSACSSQQRLPATACNELIDQWNNNMHRYAAYRQQITIFRNLVAVTKPTTSATQIMVAKISPEIVDAVLTKPEVNTLAFESVPAVQLRLNDLKTDLATFATKVGDTKLTSQDGSWATAVSEGDVKRLVAFEKVKPGLSGAAAFDATFRAPLDRMNVDYSSAVSNLRDEYRNQCNGDPSEVRSVSDF